MAFCVGSDGVQEQSQAGGAQCHRQCSSPASHHCGKSHGQLQCCQVYIVFSKCMTFVAVVYGDGHRAREVGCP